MQAKKWIIGIIVVLVIVWIGYLLVTDTTEAPTNTGTNNDNVTEINNGNIDASMPVPGSDIPEMEVIKDDGIVNEQITKNIIIYTSSGFSPNILTIKKGESLTFVNESNRGLWVASAVHPTHEVYPEFDNRKSVPNGEKYTFKFDQVGQWKYHNHVSPADIGTIMVE